MRATYSTDDEAPEVEIEDEGKGRTALKLVDREPTAEPGAVANEPPRKRFLGLGGGVLAALLAIYIIWGSTYLGIRFAIEDFPPLLMAGLRFVIAGAVLMAFLLVRGERLPNRAEWGGAAFVGLLLLVGGNGTVTLAEQWVASGLTALMIASAPLWVALFAGLLGRWPRKIEWVGLAIGFLGVILLNFEGDMRASPLGTALLFIASISWAFGSIWSSRMTLPKGLMGPAAEMLIAGVVMTVAALGMGERITQMPGPRSLLAFAFLIVFGSLIAYSAYMYLLRNVRPTLATSYAYVNPVVAVGLGVGLAGEHIAAYGLVAMLVIVLGVALLLLAKR